MAELMDLGYSSDRPENIRQLLFVSVDLLPQVWPQVKPLFLERPEQWEELFTIESIAFLLGKGKMQLWTLNDENEFLLALITELIPFPKTTLLNLLFLVGSELRDGLEFLDCIEMWAKKHGATKSVARGNAAMFRLLRPHGYAEERSVFGKDISRMREH